tara:strand:+ start:3767 stop:3988 length:222 start_codon:yes stop_codon:yes gene_type:complete
MSIDNKSDFTLFNMAYINPNTLEPVWVGEMRGWHARKFIKDCEQKGLSVLMERTTEEESDVLDFIMELGSEDS